MNADRLQWHARWAIGVTSVDDGHVELVELYNRIADACEEGEPTSYVRERIRSFLVYARWHFADEEQHMRGVKYPQFLEHKAYHDRLLQDAQDFVQNLGGPLRGEDSVAVAKYFKHWLSHHMAGPDQKLSEFIAGSGGRLQPATVSPNHEPRSVSSDELLEVSSIDKAVTSDA